MVFRFFAALRMTGGRSEGQFYQNAPYSHIDIIVFMYIIVSDILHYMKGSVYYD